jgi:predicted secreted protein
MGKARGGEIYAAASDKTPTRHDQTSSREVTTKAGDLVSVAFDIAGGAGHKWWPQTPLPAGIQLIETRLDSIEGEKLGGRMRQTLVFRSATPGTTEVVLIFRRSWTQASPIDPKMILKVITTE